MKYVDPCDRTVLFGTGGLQAPIIYVIDLPYHPFEVGAAARDCVSTIVKVPVNEWDDSLTPWAAPGLYHGDADFKGEAAVTLEELLDEAVPAIERAEGLAPAKRAICGYSLGGLFALYAFVHSDRFDACGCLSGSVWYEGWVNHLRSLDFTAAGRYAFLSIGSNEKHARESILHTVQDNMEACAEILRSQGCEADFVVGPGGHFDHAQERFAAGFKALDAFLNR